MPPLSYTSPISTRNAADGHAAYDTTRERDALTLFAQASGDEAPPARACAFCGATVVGHGVVDEDAGTVFCDSDCIGHTLEVDGNEPQDPEPMTAPTKIDTAPLVCRPARPRRRSVLPRKSTDLGDVLVGAIVAILSIGGILVAMAGAAHASGFGAVAPQAQSVAAPACPCSCAASPAVQAAPVPATPEIGPVRGHAVATECPENDLACIDRHDLNVYNAALVLGSAEACGSATDQGACRAAYEMTAGEAVVAAPAYPACTWVYSLSSDGTAWVMQPGQEPRHVRGQRGWRPRSFVGRCSIAMDGGR